MGNCTSFATELQFLLWQKPTRQAWETGLNPRQLKEVFQGLRGGNYTDGDSGVCGVLLTQYKALQVVRRDFHQQQMSAKKWKFPNCLRGLQPSTLKQRNHPLNAKATKAEEPPVLSFEPFGSAQPRSLKPWVRALVYQGCSNLKAGTCRAGYGSSM